MSHMRVACISNCTFYLHQRQYLEPSIVSVWNKDNQGYWHTPQLTVLHFPLVVMDELIALDIQPNMGRTVLLI